MDVPEWRRRGECGECCPRHPHPVDHLVSVCVCVGGGGGGVCMCVCTCITVAVYQPPVSFFYRFIPFLLFLRFAFNAGSAESISGKAIHAAVGRIALVMCLGCASAGIFQTCISGLVQIHKRDETFNSNEIANALLGGLVSVTGCCPFIDPRWAILIGGKLTLSYRPPSM